NVAAQNQGCFIDLRPPFVPHQRSLSAVCSGKDAFNLTKHCDLDWLMEENGLPKIFRIVKIYADQ
ncbi:MAG: hypothetical protein EBW19_05735, partial [Betaproteobacteria bacterium]|nr:hypothetical protein [Betaproteobacteria bacterium]